MDKRWLLCFKSLLTIHFKEFYRDFVSTVLSILMPVFFVIIFGVMNLFLGNSSSKIKFDARSEYEVSIGRGEINEWPSLFKVINDSPSFKGRVTDPESALKMVMSEEVSVGVLFFEDNDENGIKVISSQASDEIAQNLMALLGSNFSDVRIELFPVEPINKVGRTKFTDYLEFLMPALLVLALVNLCIFGTATPLVAAKERGTLRQFMVIPVPFSALIASYTVVRLVIAWIQAFCLLFLTHYVFSVEITGNIFVLLLVITIGAIAFITCGYALGGIFRSVSTATASFMFLNFFILAFGQIFTDLRGIPVLEWLIYLSPTTYLADAVRQVMVSAVGMFAIWIDLLILLGFVGLAVYVGLAKFSYLPRDA